MDSVLSLLTFSIEDGGGASSGEEICVSGSDDRVLVGGPSVSSHPNTLKEAPWKYCFAVLQREHNGKACAKAIRGSSFLTNLRLNGPVSRKNHAVLLTAAHVLCYDGTSKPVPMINLYHSYDLENPAVLHLDGPAGATPLVQLDYGCNSSNGCYRVHPKYDPVNHQNDVGVIFIKFDVLEQLMKKAGIPMDSGFIVDPQRVKSLMKPGDAITVAGFPRRYPVFYHADMTEDISSPRNHRLVKHDGVFNPINLAGVPHDLAVHLVDTSSGSSGGPVFAMRAQQSGGQAVAYALAIHFLGLAHQQFNGTFKGAVPTALSGLSGFNVAHWITDDLVKWCSSAM